MRKALICLMVLASAPLMAQEASSAATPPETPAETTAEATDGIFLDTAPESLEALRWQKRIVAVFADSPEDPQFRRQMESLQRDPQALAYRDVVVLTDTDPAAQSALRETFRPRGFMMVLVGKDGQIKLRKPLPWDVREISRAIDKTPLRQQELRDLGQRGGVALGR
ncbi:hypothetical protein GCM10011360_23100 [Primorskyibacter flagellatus]|uniref:DUF4174 domain-containing protein n=1 Tax=Primorskyibacter flagellatus TaxID=1387277 RepID=A0A917AA87_9RHOB|nr:DUF4174 domain-containing protein [Primorskyibacter flagellatus]GGE34608.1 hypothetical protein GCM10011360_23100 [Primorskyibacter flagellatus]